MQTCGDLSKLHGTDESRIRKGKATRGWSDVALTRPSSICRMARLALTRMTIQAKTRWYMALARPSRTLAATSGEVGETIQSEPEQTRIETACE